MNIAIYPGTFDPITNGHVDVIARAAKIFDKVVVGVAISVRKDPYFKLEDRLAMVKKCFADQANVEVKPLDGLLIQFANDNNANIILRVKHIIATIAR